MNLQNNIVNFNKLFDIVLQYNKNEDEFLYHLRIKNMIIDLSLEKVPIINVPSPFIELNNENKNKEEEIENLGKF
jgi:hypothetical protein